MEQSIGTVDDSLWYDHNTNEPIAISVLLELESRELYDILSHFNPEAAGTVRSLITDRPEYRRLRISKQIVATQEQMEWQLQELKWGTLDIFSRGRISALEPTKTEPKAMKEINGSWHAFGDGWSVEGETQEEALQKFRTRSANPEFRQEEQDLMSIIRIEEWESFIAGLMEHLKSQYKVIQAARDFVQPSSNLGLRNSIINQRTLSTILNLSQSAQFTERRAWNTIRNDFETLHGQQLRLESGTRELYLSEGDLPTTVANVGGGDQALLELIYAINQGPPILAIEEPENHLNARLIKRLYEAYFVPAVQEQERQLLIVTHSPFLVDKSKVNTLLVASKPDKATTYKTPAKLDELRDMLLILGVKPSDFFFADAVLIVEGESDKVFLIGVSAQLGINLQDLQVALVPARGASKGRYHLKQWIEVSRDVGIPIYMLVDSNAKPEADRVIKDQLIATDRCKVLSRGDIEDYYPEEALRTALETLVDGEIPPDADLKPGQRVKKLDKLIGKKAEEWKVPLAEEMARLIRPNEIDDELSSFLRKIHSEVRQFNASAG